MKKTFKIFILMMTMGLMLAACGTESEESTADQDTEINQEQNQEQDEHNPSATNEQDVNNSTEKEEQEQEALTTKTIVDKMLEKVEQPPLIEMQTEMIEDMYGIDSAVLEEYTVLIPLMNTKTNEIALFKLKDEQDKTKIEEGIQKRAGDIQKQFETYLPDQYQNAKNYKLITEGVYVLFIISESADQLENEFRAFFN